MKIWVCRTAKPNEAVPQTDKNFDATQRVSDVDQADEHGFFVVV